MKIITVITGIVIIITNISKTCRVIKQTESAAPDVSQR